MTDIELAWAAGLFEGEGSIRINAATKRNLGHLVVSVVNTDIEVINFFAQRWPGYFKRATGLGPRQKPAWVWVVASRKAASFIRQIQPYLRCARVKEKAKHGLDFQDGKTAVRAVNMSQEYREEQFGAYLWMKHLNARGVS